jgi:hypothetical protein
VTGTDPGTAGYDENGFSCWNDPLAPIAADFCGNGTGNPFTAPASGWTIANRALPAGLGQVVDNMNGTITINLSDSTYTDCVNDAGCTPGSNSADIFAQWRVNAIQVVPIPAASWLFGSALGLLAWLRRRTA